jgi:ribosome-binding factor A
MSQQTESRTKEILRALASEFLMRESNRTSLITITSVELEARSSRAKIFFTVLPENQEQAALDFFTRRLRDLREYVQEHARMMRVPFFEVAIDVGEKNRQRIDEIERQVESK